MLHFNNILLIVFFAMIASTIRAYFACQDKAQILRSPWRLCEVFGSFVWADHIILGPFWALISLVCYLLQDMLLFMLIFSVFWLIRSCGEVLYWFLQQFHPRAGNEPEQYWIHRHAPGEAVWFLHQIFWQCISVFAIILTIYFAYHWILTF